ncbi:MAG: LamG domain-containing protein, partial [Verrucomicrobia bacterium]|nr:LamG domain-containing protein [Verrucomicrobiota bacterium]
MKPSLTTLFSWATLILSAAGASGAVAATPPIADKTLVVWVAPANLTQRGGSALTIEKPGGVFDAVVLGELVPAKWMAGSDGFRRTKQDQGSFATETADNQTLVQLAIVYKDKQITLYRNGSQYASYTAEGAEKFGDDSKVLLGLRHTDANPDNRFFTGAIDDARIYGIALDAGQIAALKPNQPSDPKPLAWWDFEEGRAGDRMKVFPTTTLFGEARIANGKLYLDKNGAYLLASRTAAQ